MTFFESQTTRIQGRESSGRGRKGTRTGRKLTIRAIKAAKHTGGSYGEKGKGARQ